MAVDSARGHSRIDPVRNAPSGAPASGIARASQPGGGDAHGLVPSGRVKPLGVRQALMAGAGLLVGRAAAAAAPAPAPGPADTCPLQPEPASWAQVLAHPAVPLTISAVLTLNLARKMFTTPATAAKESLETAPDEGSGRIRGGSKEEYARAEREFPELYRIGEDALRLAAYLGATGTRYSPQKAASHLGLDPKLIESLTGSLKKAGFLTGKAANPLSASLHRKIDGFFDLKTYGAEIANTPWK